MNGSVRDLVAKLVSNHRPSLFYFKADPELRRGISVRENGDAIDIRKLAERKLIRIGRNNAVYLVDMIESFDYYFRSAMPVRIRTAGGAFDMVDFSTPRLHQVIGFDDFPVMCPSLTEPYSTTAQYLDFAALREGDIVFDLGSYSALTSIVFSKAVGPSGKVIALEPDPGNFSAAEVNVAAHSRVNHLDNIVLHAAAVSAHEGTLQLSCEGAMGSALTSIVGAYRGDVVDVPCETLEGLVARFALPRVDFIKMDIEGSELSVITQSTAFFARHRPRMIIEPHIVDGRLTTEPITAFLGSLGYVCSVIEQNALTIPLITAAHPSAA